MHHPLLQIVDENDNPIGAATKEEAISGSNFHRISRIMLENPDGKILLQKRTMNVVFPGLWDHSAAGHVDEGEDYLTAAKREMFEEIGVKTDLEEVAYYKHEEKVDGYVLRRFNKLYKGTIDFTPNNLNKDEVSEVKWFSLEEIKDMIKNRPNEMTKGLKYVIGRHYL
ncbi:NUDIX domain-containing protein [Candidatus Saccharibacteria bacterium]|nr:NUDIX domain-containing protein [Candidatus Saccharibacteria bacterium]